MMSNLFWGAGEVASYDGTTVNQFTIAPSVGMNVSVYWGRDRFSYHTDFLEPPPVPKEILV